MRIFFLRGGQNLVNLCLKCSVSHLQASLIPKFSTGDNPVPTFRGELGKRERKAKGKERGRLRRDCRVGNL